MIQRQSTNERISFGNFITVYANVSMGPLKHTLVVKDRYCLNNDRVMPKKYYLQNF